MTSSTFNGKAMEYAYRIQPFRSASSFRYLADVLNMPGGLPGGRTQCYNITYDGPEQDFHPSFPIPMDKATVFADANAGDDQIGDGSLESPFRSIERALQAVRGSVAQNEGTQGGAIILRAGTYYLQKTLQLGPSDSGLTVQSYRGEEVWLSGAKLVKVNWMRGARPGVWVANLTGTGVNGVTGMRFVDLDRKRAVRARYPNGCTSDDPLPSKYVCVGRGLNGSVVDPNDGFGSNVVGDWVPADDVGMSQPNWTQVNLPEPVRPSYDMAFRTFQVRFLLFAIHNQ